MSTVSGTSGVARTRRGVETWNDGARRSPDDRCRVAAEVDAQERGVRREPAADDRDERAAVRRARVRREARHVEGRVRVARAGRAAAAVDERHRGRRGLHGDEPEVARDDDRAGLGPSAGFASVWAGVVTVICVSETFVICAGKAAERHLRRRDVRAEVAAEDRDLVAAGRRARDRVQGRDRHPLVDAEVRELQGGRDVRAAGRTATTRSTCSGTTGFLSVRLGVVTTIWFGVQRGDRRRRAAEEDGPGGVAEQAAVDRHRVAAGARAALGRVRGDERPLARSCRCR